MSVARTTKATAYHEAGHAVAIWYIGESIYAVQVASRDETFVDRRGRAVRAIGLVEASGSYNVGYPGHIGYAEMARFLRASGGDEAVSTIRLNALCSMIVNMAGSVAEARVSRASGAFAWLAARDDREHWEATRDDFPEEMRRPLEVEADRAATLLVRKGWAAISALGDALRTTGSMDGERVTALIATAWPDAGPIEGIPRKPWAAAAGAAQ